MYIGSEDSSRREGFRAKIRGESQDFCLEAAGARRLMVSIVAQISRMKEPLPCKVEVHPSD